MTKTLNSDKPQKVKSCFHLLDNKHTKILDSYQEPSSDLYILTSITNHHNQVVSIPALYLEHNGFKSQSRQWLT